MSATQSRFGPAAWKRRRTRSGATDRTRVRCAPTALGTRGLLTPREDSPMRRLLARPPKLTVNSSFGEAYPSGRFTQLELVSNSELISEAKRHGLTVDDATLEDLDRHAAFTPVAFVGAEWHGDFFGPRWNLDALTFRDEVGYHRWSRYRFREEGARRVIALYSPWQLMYLKSALEDRLVLFTLPYILGRRERLLRGINNM